MRFRPCIDLHQGEVKQIVGSSLSDENPDALITNFQAEMSAADYAELYARDNLPGGHVIQLGPGNKEAALSAVAAYPGGLHVGGGINPENAEHFLDGGASHVIVTSYVFRHGNIDYPRLNEIVKKVGKHQLVLDLSCRKRGNTYYVVTDRWQRFSETEVNEANLAHLSQFCDEFLVHAADVEGKREGMDEELITLLGEVSPLPVTYAGGAKEFADLDRVKALGQGRVDLTIGSALDIFGGSIPYKSVLEWQRAQENERQP